MVKKSSLFFTIALCGLLALGGCEYGTNPGKVTPSVGPQGTSTPAVGTQGTNTPSPLVSDVPQATAGPTETATPTETAAPTEIVTPTESLVDTPMPTDTPIYTPGPAITEIPLLDVEEMSAESIKAVVPEMSRKLLETAGLMEEGKEGIWAIWKWVAENVKGDTDRYTDNEMKAAYTGLKDRKGGNVTRNAVFAALMEEAGYEHLSVSSVEESYNHSWNICNINGQWYHFDFYKHPRGNYVCFMQTEGQVKAMEADLNKSFYFYDLPEGLPERSEEKVYNGYMERWITEPELTLSKQDILNKLQELKELYPSGKYWNNGGVTDTPCEHKTSTSTCNRYISIINNVYVHGAGGRQCLGFGNLLSDEIFGKDTGVYAFTNFDDLKVGDLFRIMVKPDNSGIIYHTAMIIEKHADYVLVAEVNYDFQTCKIRWGGKYTKSYLEARGTWYISREYTLIE